MGTFTVITPPKIEPVSIAEAKIALRILHDDEDVRISQLIKTAREYAEDYCNIITMTTVIELSFDKWPSNVFSLNKWPLQSIDSIKYDDTSSPSVELTLTENVDYYADIKTENGRISTITGWPSHAVTFNPIRIRMTAGYSSAENVPEQIKDGIKAYAAYLYDQDPDLEKAARKILWPRRIL